MISENTTCSTRDDRGWNREKRSVAVVSVPGQRVSRAGSEGAVPGRAASSNGPTPNPSADPLGRTTSRSAATRAAAKLTLLTSKSPARTRRLRCSMSWSSTAKSSPRQSTVRDIRPWKANVSLGQVEIARRIGWLIGRS